MGKHYVCSDIHGMKGSYENVLEKLNEDDILYILGDAIDRGDEGIEILLDILTRSGENGKKPRVEYILGNHDLLFIENMETIMRHGIKIRNQTDLDLWDTFEYLCCELENARIFEGRSGKEEYETIIEKVSWLKDVSFEEMKALANHIYNDGRLTIFNFMRMREDVQKQLYSFLENCLLQKPLTIDGKNFIVTHATPIPVLPHTNQGITLKQARSMIKGTTNIEKDKQALLHYLSARDNDANVEWKKWLQMGYYTICGHTPSRGMPDVNKDYGRIIIDTGVVSSGDLALVNIDDGELTMIGTKGKINGKEKDYKPDSYVDKSKVVKDFFDSIPVTDRNNMSAQPKQNIAVMSNQDIDIFAQSAPTPQISELPVKKSYITAYHEMKNRMENGDAPTQEDIRILMKLSTQKLDSDTYSYEEEQLRLKLLNWGGITPQLNTLRVEKSYTEKFREMQNRMENNEAPTIDDMDILWNLFQNDFDPTFYDEKARQLRLKLLSWGGIIKNSNMQSPTNQITDYSYMYHLTDINKIDAMMARLQQEKAKLQASNSIDKHLQSTLE